MEIVRGDMTDEHSIVRSLQEVQAVVHLAAATSEQVHDKKHAWDVNVGGAKRLVDSCKKGKVKRLIVVSSESCKRKVRGVYAETKARADEIFMKSSLEVTIIRPTLVYGFGGRGLFAKMKEYIETLPIVPIIGDGNVRLSPTHVEDVSFAILQALKKNKSIGKDYDLTGAEYLTFNRFVEEIMSALTIKKKLFHIPFNITFFMMKMLSLVLKNPPITIDNLLGYKQEIISHSNLAKRDLGYKPIGIREGIKKTIFPTTNAKVKKVAIIGLGKMGLLHASIINSIKGAKLVAVMDKNKKQNEQLKSWNIDVPFFTDLDIMCGAMDIQHIIACTPPSVNRSIAEVCAKRNISLFVEKPMAASLKDAEYMQKLFKNKVSAVGYMLLYAPTFAKVKDLLNVVGKIEEVRAEALLSRVFKKHKGWHYTKQSAGGGAVITIASHVLSLLYYYFGLPKTVTAKTFYKYCEVEDAAEASFNYGGFRANLFTSWSKKGYPLLHERIIIKGSKGEMTVDDSSITLDMKKEEAYLKGATRIHKSEIVDSSDIYIGRDGYYLQDKSFIGGRSKTTFKEGLDIQNMINAIYVSASKKKEVLI